MTDNHNNSNNLLDKNQIHIWKIDSNSPTPKLDHLYSKILSHDERERADRLVSDSDKRRFVISRGLLRKTLGRYVDSDPSDIHFTYNKYGKPDIKSDHNMKNIKFNVSHSANITIFAIGQDREIGVDVEHIREVSKADKIISRFFSKEESEYYYSKAEVDKKLTFFSLWTRKEAYSKAKGRGIGLPSKDFELNLVPNNSSTTHNSNNNSNWSLIDIEVDKDYIATLATQGNNIEICNCVFEL